MTPLLQRYEPTMHAAMPTSLRWRTSPSKTPSSANCPRTRFCITCRARCGMRAIPRSIPHRCVRRDWSGGRPPSAECSASSVPPSAVGLEAQVLAGNPVLPGMRPYAANYGGHQFGHWAGQLGDGRAIMLGEWSAPTATATSCSSRARAGRPTRARPTDARCCARRFASSCAARRCTTSACRRRARCSLVATGESVMRDMFYDGHPRAEPGAIVCRVAPTFLRFGNFEISRARRASTLLKRLADYALAHHFRSSARRRGRRTRAGSTRSARRTARADRALDAVGFVHGVMNTDNMSILGLTIDYGPYGWLDGYDPRLDAEHHGRREPALPVRQSTVDRLWNWCAWRTR